LRVGDLVTRNDIGANRTKSILTFCPYPLTV
jgi:hypothetical protein